MDRTGPIWIVGAGERAAYVDEFLQEGVVAIGWSDAGPVEATMPDEDLDRRLATAYPDEKEGWRRVAPAMIRRFAREIHPGERRN